MPVYDKLSKTGRCLIRHYVLSPRPRHTCSVLGSNQHAEKRPPPARPDALGFPRTTSSSVTVRKDPAERRDSRPARVPTEEQVPREPCAPWRCGPVITEHSHCTGSEAATAVHGALTRPRPSRRNARPRQAF